MSKWKVIAPLGVLAAGAAAAAVLLLKKDGGEASPKTAARIQSIMLLKPSAKDLSG